MRGAYERLRELGAGSNAVLRGVCILHVLDHLTCSLVRAHACGVTRITRDACARARAHGHARARRSYAMSMRETRDVSCVLAKARSGRILGARHSFKRWALAIRSGDGRSPFVQAMGARHSFRRWALAIRSGDGRSPCAQATGARRALRRRALAVRSGDGRSPWRFARSPKATRTKRAACHVDTRPRGAGEATSPARPPSSASHPYARSMPLAARYRPRTSRLCTARWRRRSRQPRRSS